MNQTHEDWVRCLEAGDRVEARRVAADGADVLRCGSDWLPATVLRNDTRICLRFEEAFPCWHAGAWASIKGWDVVEVDSIRPLPSLFIIDKAAPSSASGGVMQSHNEWLASLKPGVVIEVKSEDGWQAKRLNAIVSGYFGGLRYVYDSGGGWAGAENIRPHNPHERCVDIKRSAGPVSVTIPSGYRIISGSVESGAIKTSPFGAGVKGLGLQFVIDEAGPLSAEQLASVTNRPMLTRDGPPRPKPAMLPPAPAEPPPRECAGILTMHEGLTNRWGR